VLHANPQAPFEHVGLAFATDGQLLGVPHCPLDAHVSVCVFDAHWIEPGTQTPVQLPFEHTNGQALPEVH